MSTATKNEVVVERLINATPERIFRALTDAGELEKWMFTECRTDPRPGGDYRVSWISEKDPAKNHDRFGKYLEFVPNERLSFEWLGDPQGVYGLPEGLRTVVTITLQREGSGTRLRLVHSGWPDTERGNALREGHDGGWTFYLGNLDRYLHGGEDLRPGHNGQRVKA